MKPFYKSTTVWLNVLAVVVLVLDSVLRFNVIQDKDVVAIVVAVLNLLNRFRTNEPLSLR